MSKKMMKRSLALGALMAFVITGSAFAETHYIIKLDGSVAQESPANDARVTKGSEPSLTISKWDDFKDVEIFGKMYYPGSEKLEDDTVIEGNIAFSGNIATSSNPTYANTDLNGKTLTVTYEEDSGSAISATGIYNNFINDKIYVEGEDNSYQWHKIQNKFSLDIPGFNFTNGSLVVDSSNYGIHGYGTVDVNTLKITSVNNAIQSKLGSKNGSDLSLDIEAKNIELCVGENGHAMQVENTLNIESEVLNINSIEGSSYQRPIRVKGATANIEVGTLNISGATVSSKVDGNGTLSLTADSGNIVSGFEVGETENEETSKGTVNLTFGSGVTLTGSVVTDTVGTGENASASNITLNGATWKVTGDSNITTLAGNGGKIELALRNEAVALADSEETNTAFYGLHIGNLTNENLEVSGGEALTQAIENGDITAEEALQQMADSVQTGEESTVKNVSKVTVEAGDTTGAASATIGADGKISSIKQDVNPEAAKVSKAATNLKAHYRAHMNDMNKRMGELRMANGEAGVWTRMVRGESEYEGAKMQYNQYQLGYDEKLSVDKRWTVGAAVTFAEGDGSYGQGSTEDKSTAFAIYGSKLNNDGTFVDLIARYAHLESDMEDGKYGNGDYSTNGMSVSAEFGKRIQQGNGLWVEPQVELTYGTVDSANFKLDKGYNAHFDSMDSFIARVGLSVGKDIKQGNVYARASYLYDFDGETTSLITNQNGIGTPTPEDFGGGWWEVGVGANINLSKATYIYADVEKTFGGEVDTNWQWNLGVRYSF